MSNTLSNNTHYTIVSGIILTNNQLLLVKNKYKAGVEKWTLPGGKVEFGETLFDALVREIMEETGFYVQSAKLAYLHESFFLNVSAHVRAFIFKIESLIAPKKSYTFDQDPTGTVVANKLVMIEELPQYIHNLKLLEPLQKWLNHQSIIEYFFTKDMEW